MLDQIENRFEKFLIDLETIVNIDSGSRYVPGLEAVSAFFQERFQKIGWTTTNYSFDEGKVPCLEAANKPLAGNDSALDLLFIGLEMKLTTTGGCSDGNYTAALGIPTIDAMGVRGGCVHSEDEYIELDSILPNMQLMLEIVKAVADGRIS